MAPVVEENGEKLQPTEETIDCSSAKLFILQFSVDQLALEVSEYY